MTSHVRGKVGVVSRADLVDLIVSSTEAKASVQFFEYVGYEEKPKPVEPIYGQANITLAGLTVYSTVDPEWTQFQPAPTQYWRATKFTSKEIPKQEDVPVEREVVIRSPEDIVREANFSPSRGLTFQPLAEPNYLLTQLRRVSGTRKSRHQLDILGAVSRLSRGEFLYRIPRRSRRVWGHDLLIMEDRARRLVPYWTDQDIVTTLLKNIYPSWGLSVARLHDGCRRAEMTEPKERRYRPYETPPPDTLVLALTDLGCLMVESVSDIGEKTESQNDRQATIDRWCRLGRELRDNGNRAIALVPCHPSQIPIELAQLWTIVPWERVDANTDLRDASTALARLLRLLSPVVRLEPELLRAMRRLCPGTEHDAGMEALAWQSELIDGENSVAASLNDEVRKTLLQQFETEPPELRSAALKLILGVRQWSHPSIWFEEVLSLSRNSQSQLENPEHIRLATSFFENLDRDPKLAPGLAMKAWIKRWADRLPHSGSMSDALKKQLSDLLNKADKNAERETKDWELDHLPPALGEEKRVRIEQAAGNLVFSVLPDSAIDRTSQVGKGVALSNFLGEVRSSTLEFHLFDASPKTPEKIQNWFRKNGPPPKWAVEWGYDKFGPTASFRVGGVVQLMRWIPAGRFLMGSPDDEEGRWEHEVPQHEVEISRGFWMFDTPCTQELWHVVMRDDPSHFKRATRPIESVDWNRVQDFMKRINELVGMSLRLPTEAEWEYSCRAGTTSARYGELDAIAWYDENSKRETHDVKQKLPNDWGLFDMLGNVFEWCHDEKRSYSKSAAKDPGLDPSSAAGRVIRGGGWFLSALCARAAYRFGFPPSFRSTYLGFRCLSSVEPGSEDFAEPSSDARHVGVSRRSRSDRQHALPPDDLRQRAIARPRLIMLRESQLVTSTDFVASPSLLIESDRETIQLELAPAPAWAVASGRDRFGLWSDLEVKRVRQRLRWIPPGKFLMGSPEDEEGRSDDEGPQHEVTISNGFWLFDTPCTQDLWQAVMNDNPSYFKGGRRPVEQVSWDDANAYIAKMNDSFMGLNLRLPTEAEWEYSCRAGTTGARYGDLDQIGWYRENSNDETHEVGKKFANPWGLYDTLGNVWEWCFDSVWRRYDSERQLDPIHTSSAAYRVIRGGSWSDSARSARAAFRYGFRPSDRDRYLGIRCLSSVEPSSRVFGRAETGGNVSEPSRSRSDRDRESPRSGKDFASS